MSEGHAFPYQRIVDDLRTEIITGNLTFGEKLPSENTLAQRYGTTRPTVRRALALLKAEGLVTTRQGQGVFVRPKPRVRLLISGSNYRTHREAGLPGFNAQVREQGMSPEQRIRDVATLDAPAEIAHRLELDQNAQVVVRRRTFLVDGLPIALCDSYYPAALAADTVITQPRRIKGGVYALIEDPDGPIRRQVSHSVEDLICRMPTREETTELNLMPGVPVVRVIRTVYDSENRPLEVQESTVAADSHEFRYEVKMR
ncbi:GntR family transcriptional regulator [Streptosporangium saharense]|uniref:GntR family transcriptional regulator n=1 Tax=Streptosporangium saharense TaxID=1706840 RepID=A0A7W7QWC4_9ACTN|nr:GntR family transcriptional regulator [Streptosporangium saharense]MBB4921007.1 GntR family transcriptional regulator [Streptosporangium saharense]